MQVRILVVDDNPEIVSNIREFLELQQQWSVETVASGLVALDMIAHRPYDFMVLDLGLPGMDGLTVCRMLRSQGSPLPVLMLTKPDADYDPESGKRRDIIRATYEHAVAAGDKRVWFIDGATYYGDTDRDACSADTCHPNDLGMYRMAQTIRPVMEEMLALVDR